MKEKNEIINNTRKRLNMISGDFQNGNKFCDAIEEIIDYVLSKNIKITTLKELYNKSGFGNLGQERYVATQDNIYNTQQIDILNKIH